MSNLQDDVFAASEADHWFRRNRDGLHRFDAGTDAPLRLLARCGVVPRAALELGASNGARLGALRRAAGCRAVAVEPSAEAVADGRRLHPEVEFRQASAHHTGLSERFDLVIVNFVLHWVDRSRVLAVAAEIDRLLEPGGHLLLGDFCPPGPCRVAYHHRTDERLFTYKQDYARLFLGTGLYALAGQESGHHAKRGPVTDASPQDRTSVALLRRLPPEESHPEATL